MQEKLVLTERLVRCRKPDVTKDMLKWQQVLPLISARQHGTKVMTSTPITTTESLLVSNSKPHTTLTQEKTCHGSTIIILTATLHGIRHGYKVDLMEVAAERCAHTGHVSSDITKV